MLNGSDLIVPFGRLSSTNSLSFVLSSVRQQNKLENSVRNLDTPSKFKRALLNNANEINIVPKHFLKEHSFSVSISYLVITRI
jgi:hypothetical protein